MINRRSRQSADPGHQTDPTTSQCVRFQGDEAPPALFIQNNRHLPISLACSACLRNSNHAARLRRATSPRESPLSDSSRSVAVMTQLFMDGPLGPREARSIEIGDAVFVMPDSIREE